MAGTQTPDRQSGVPTGFKQVLGVPGVTVVVRGTGTVCGLGELVGPSPGPSRPALTSPVPATPGAEDPLEALRFHPEAKGAQVRLDARRCTARRHATFHDGIVFSQRPVLPGERVALRVLRHEDQWRGSLRVGFTRLDTAHVPAPSLPPFVCPDLEEQSPTWAAMLPEGCALAGDVVCFWVNRRGQLFAKVNARPRILLRKGVLMGTPLWAMMDVYGTTKAIELLGEATGGTQAPPPGKKVEAQEECAICFHYAANTCLLPCGHTHFCSSCAWRVFRDTAKCPMCRWQIETVTLVQGHPAVRSGEGS
ncbi:LOW QUALITY PROTEIN: E3 ubiquitin-protein ligase NEURL3 [Dugong dugon]